MVIGVRGALGPRVRRAAGAVSSTGRGNVTTPRLRTVEPTAPETPISWTTVTTSSAPCHLQENTSMYVLQNFDG